MDYMTLKEAGKKWAYQCPYDKLLLLPKVASPAR